MIIMSPSTEPREEGRRGGGKGGANEAGEHTHCA